MAKKEKKILTPEEKLKEALVPVEEQPYEVPKNWCWTRMSDVAQWGSGGTPSRKQPEFFEGTIPWIKTGELNDGYIYETEEHISESALLNSNVKIYPINTIAIAMYGATIGKVGILGVEATTNQACACGVCTSVLIYRYLFHYACSQKDAFIRKGKGGAQPNISQEIIKNHVIPLPPFSEQHRIVNCIESLFAKLDEAKEAAQAVVDGFEDRKAAILHKAFMGELTKEWREQHECNSKDLFDNITNHLKRTKRKKHKKVQNDLRNGLERKIPENWILVDLDDISNIITDGEHKTPNRVNTFCGFYLLSARNIRDDEIRLEDVDYIDETEYNIISKRCSPKRNDILISCSGSVGRCCVVSDDNCYCMVRSAAMISVCACNPRFVMYMLQSDACQEQIRRLSKQTAQANLFLGAIASILIPLPPLEEQDHLVKRMDELMQSMRHAKASAEAVLVQIDTMKKSILARAFRGELGTNDPNDEPAIELLKRVLKDTSKEGSES